MEREEQEEEIKYVKLEKKLMKTFQMNECNVVRDQSGTTCSSLLSSSEAHSETQLG